jgi:hypothetical protein
MLAQTRAAMFLLGPDNKELAISRKKYKDLVDRRKAGSRMYSFDGQNARLIKDSRMTELKDGRPTPQVASIPLQQGGAIRQGNPPARIR